MSAKSPARRSDPFALPDVLEFMQVLWALTHALERASKRMSSTLGITGPQRLTLRVIGLVPGISAGELARVLHIDPSTLTGVLQRLVRRGLVTRRSAKGDRRLAVLQLTREGARANRNSRGTVEAAVTRTLAQSTRVEQVAARRLLARLATRLDPDGPTVSAARTRRVRRQGGRA